MKNLSFNNAFVNRNRTLNEGHVARGELGRLRHQFLSLEVYLEAQADQQRTGSEARRLWIVDHALACDRSIAREES